LIYGLTPLPFSKQLTVCFSE